MAHEIDMSNGRENIAWRNETPWHGLGTTPRPGATIEEWRKEAGLNWMAVPSPVRFRNVVTGEETQWDERVVLSRNDNGAPLSVVSDGYVPHQPHEILDFFRDVAGELGAFEMDVVGSLRGGRKIWALARAKDGTRLGLEDKLERYLLLATSYDQSIPTIAQQTSIRVVCANTLAAAMGQTTDRRISVKHSTTFKSDRVKARLAMEAQWATFCEVVEKMASRPLAAKEAHDFFAGVFYPGAKFEVARNDPESRHAQMSTRLEELAGIFRHAPGQQTSSARDTLWGAVNAVTYYVDHKSKSRTNDVRLDKAWFGDGATIKDRAADLALAMVS